MTPINERASAAQDIPVIGYDEGRATRTWIRHRALMLALRADPSLADEIWFNSERAKAFADFCEAFR